jgi:trk system potassium uptake protein TrkA
MLGTQLGAPNLLNYLPLAQGFRVEEIAPPAEFVGKTLLDLKLRTRFKVQVVAIHERIPDRMHMVPDPGIVIRDDHSLVVVGKEDDLLRLKETTKGAR